MLNVEINITIYLFILIKITRKLKKEKLHKDKLYVRII